MSLSNNSTILNNILTKVNNLPSVGTSLNFTVVGGTTEPSNRTENMIWVNTSTTISGWVFSPTEPTSPSPNSVWIRVGSSSDVGFNAIVSNSIELYPSSIQQYINGSWVGKDAKSWQGGKWVDWWNGELYILGEEYISVTGGWDEYHYGTGTGYITKNIDSITISKSGVASGYTWAGPVNPINLKDFKTLKINIISHSRSPADANATTKIFITTDRNPNTGVAGGSITKAGEYSFDISSLDEGSYYILIAVYTYYTGAKANMAFNKVWLE